MDGSETYKAQLADLQNKFIQYADSFMTGDAEHDKNIMLKREHSLLVMQECSGIAASEEFSPHDKFLAEVIGLFHDIGRFEQYRQHQTFLDHKSVNHGQLGASILETTDFLEDFTDTERSLIITAVLNHNSRQLPDELIDQHLLFSQIVRDGDKLDIMRVVLEYYSKLDHDDVVMLHLKESPNITPKVSQAILNRQNPFLSDFQTITDFKISQLAWVFDLNFPHSIKEFKRRKFHLQIKNHLPDTSEANQLCNHIFAYLDSADC